MASIFEKITKLFKAKEPDYVGNPFAAPAEAALEKKEDHVAHVDDRPRHQGLSLSTAEALKSRGVEVVADGTRISLIFPKAKKFPKTFEDEIANEVVDVWSAKFLDELNMDSKLSMRLLRELPQKKENFNNGRNDALRQLTMPRPGFEKERCLKISDGLAGTYLSDADVSTLFYGNPLYEARFSAAEDVLKDFERVGIKVHRNIEAISEKEISRSS